MTLLQTPREHDRQLAALEGFEAYREVVATREIRHVQAELEHVFSDDVRLLDYDDPRFESLSRISIVSRDLGVRMVRAAYRAYGLDSVDELDEIHRRLADYAGRNNKAISTHSYQFTTRPMATRNGQDTLLSMRVHQGQEAVSNDVRGLAVAASGYSHLALATGNVELSFPLAVVNRRAIAKEVGTMCMTRFMHVPLGPLTIQR